MPPKKDTSKSSKKSKEVSDKMKKLCEEKYMKEHEERSFLDAPNKSKAGSSKQKKPKKVQSVPSQDLGEEECEYYFPIPKWLPKKDPKNKKEEVEEETGEEVSEEEEDSYE
ncbi:hypothetical protein KR074_004798 [Drosophila pseudoananassae]|nr:hypothetical protein KR074_004798 [Drosophila pseudoananassae]